MTPEKLEKTDLQQFLSVLNAVHKSVIHIRQTPDQNNTIDISAVPSNDDADQPDALRVPEVIIVICVLLLWCASIIIFIRHSELLRIRHRDLPYRSSVKPAINLNHITVIHHTSDTVLHSKSGISSDGGLTPPTDHYGFHEYRQGGLSEPVTSELSPKTRKYRHTCSFDMTPSLPIGNTFDTHSDKEKLLDSHNIPTKVKENLLELHRKSVDNLHRKSMENLSTIKYSTFHSTHDMSKRKSNDGQYLSVKKRSIQESPV